MTVLPREPTELWRCCYYTSVAFHRSPKHSDEAADVPKVKSEVVVPVTEVVDRASTLCQKSKKLIFRRFFEEKRDVVAIWACIQQEGFT